jgi:TPR repeat protein
MKKIITALLSAMIFIGNVAYAVGTLKDAEKAYEMKNYSQAFNIYNSLAANQDAVAQYHLGRMYFTGQGIPQDYAEAIKFWRLAAEKGHAGAQGNLGKVYSEELGVKKDYVIAYMWFSLAAVKGNEYVMEDRVLLAKKMTVQQVLKAQKLAKECFARNYKGC